MDTKPLIGLNMSLCVSEKFAQPSLRIYLDYIDAVLDAGGVPVCLPPVEDAAMLKRLVPMFDGILFIGADDYHPRHYGGHDQTENELVPARRDHFDMEFAHMVFQETELPVLAICGGHQLVSIVQDGKLIQDITTEWRPPEGGKPLLHSKKERFGVKRTRFRHPVTMEPDSLIAKVTMNTPGVPLMTNSLHHQSVHPGHVGRDLRATAWASDGVVEAIEPCPESEWAKSGRFILGVQWHPEQMHKEVPHHNIFRAFVQAAQKHK